MNVVDIPVEEIGFIEKNVNELSGRRLQDLRESIKFQGILEPLIIVKNEHERPIFSRTISGNKRSVIGYEKFKYTVIDGNHRLGVAKSLRFSTVPCIIREMDAKDILKEHIVINFFRGEIVLQKVTGLIVSKLEEGEPIHDVAEMFGMSEAWVLSLYEMRDVKLPAEVQRSIEEDEFSKIPVFLERKTLDSLFVKILENNLDFFSDILLDEIKSTKRKISNANKEIRKLEEKRAELEQNRVGILNRFDKFKETLKLEREKKNADLLIKYQQSPEILSKHTVDVEIAFSQAMEEIETLEEDEISTLESYDIHRIDERLQEKRGTIFDLEDNLESLQNIQSNGIQKSLNSPDKDFLNQFARKRITLPDLAAILGRMVADSIDKHTKRRLGTTLIKPESKKEL